jgi:hypothetical protein
LSEVCPDPVSDCCCLDCNLSFVSVEALAAHLQSRNHLLQTSGRWPVAFDGSTTPFRCIVCWLCFYAPPDLMAHCLGMQHADAMRDQGIVGTAEQARAAVRDRGDCGGVVALTKTKRTQMKQMLAGKS